MTPGTGELEPLCGFAPVQPVEEQAPGGVGGSSRARRAIASAGPGRAASSDSTVAAEHPEPPDAPVDLDDDRGAVGGGDVAVRVRKSSHRDGQHGVQPRRVRRCWRARGVADLAPGDASAP